MPAEGKWKIGRQAPRVPALEEQVCGLNRHVTWYLRAVRRVFVERATGGGHQYGTCVELQPGCLPGSCPDDKAVPLLHAQGCADAGARAEHGCFNENIQQMKSAVSATHLL